MHFISNALTLSVHWSDWETN